MQDDESDDDEPNERDPFHRNKLFDRINQPWLWENEGKNKDDKWIGLIGDIKQKLEKNKLKYVTRKIHPTYPNDNIYPNSTPARLKKMLEQFEKKNGVIDGNEDMHLHNKRMVVIVDRRHLSTDDVITDHI